MTSPTHVLTEEPNPISTTVNGTLVSVRAAGPESAADVIRDRLGLTGTKLVRAGGVGGACTIPLDGVPVAGCLTPATALRDADVTTVEGLAVARVDARPCHAVNRRSGTARRGCRQGHAAGSARLRVR